MVVNADDLGVSQGATLGILRAHREGIVTSASLAVTSEDYRHALEVCVRPCPRLGVGLHFTLSFGRPAGPPGEIPLLVDDRGFLRWRFGPLLAATLWGRRRSALLDQIEIELEAQLDRLAGDGVAIDHLDSERHIHLIPPVFERVAAVVRRRGIPCVRLGRAAGWDGMPLHWLQLVRGAGPLKHALLSRMIDLNRRRSGSLFSADRFYSYLYTGRSDLLIPQLESLLPADAVSEVMVHPGVPEKSEGVRLGNRELERYLVSPDRRRELQACLDAKPMRDRLKLRTFAEVAQVRGRLP